MRTRSPPLRTLPARMELTPSCSPIACGSASDPLNVNVEVRPATRNCGIVARRFINSSVMPSLKYSCS